GCTQMFVWDGCLLFFGNYYVCSVWLFVFFLLLGRPPISPLFPYTTLFRSHHAGPRPAAHAATKDLPFLHRQSRFDRLQRCEAAAILHSRARQDSAASHFGDVRRASADAGRSHQARAKHRSAAVRSGLIFMVQSSSFSCRRSVPAT